MKNLKTFESYSDDDRLEYLRKVSFVKSSKDKYNSFIQDVNDILLDLKDSNIGYNITHYLDDTLFELQISTTSTIESEEDKSLVEDTIFRLNDYLKEYDLEFSYIEMEQEIEAKISFGKSGNEVHSFTIYELEEIKDLKSSPGDISIDIYFSQYNNN